MKDIDADYYGYRDDDDGLIEPFEDLEEIKHRKTRIEEWETKHENDPETEAEKEEEKDQNVEIHIPTQQEVQAALLQRMYYIRRPPRLVASRSGPASTPAAVASGPQQRVPALYLRRMGHGAHVVPVLKLVGAAAALAETQPADHLAALLAQGGAPAIVDRQVERHLGQLEQSDLRIKSQE
ncbi:unnamed protein product [Trichogramma brassicae]|uniref:Uncharacterized protein n=1 Tax=Trichogramma brassicae TaxID=86971 RepID=A0A6H5IHE7_9HYME|nr:unnamed protein product [Trichogramma brassicae]